MSWVLTDDEFALAEEAMRRGDVSRALYAFLRRVVTALVRGGGLAPALSPTGKWDEDAIDEVLHGWLGERLLRGGLARAFEVSASAGMLSRYLERALRNWLISKSRARGRPRLLARTRKILKEGPLFRSFVEAPAASDEWWGLQQWESPTPYQGSDADLVKWAFSLGEFAPLRYTAGSNLADPVVSNLDLERFVRGMFEAAAALLMLRHLDVALRGRFAYAYDEEAEPLSVIEDQADNVTPLDVIESRATAREILIELTGRQVEILRGRVLEGLGLEQLATQQSVSRGTVDNELRRASAIIRAHLLEDSRAEVVLETLFEIAFGGEVGGAE